MVARIQTGMGAVQPLVGPSPSAARREGEDIARAAGAVSEFALTVRDHHRRRELDRADTDFAVAYADSIEPFLGREYSSAADLREAGIDEDWMYRKEVGPDGETYNDREDIEQHEFLPMLVDRIMSDTAESVGSNIAWGSDREAWLNERKRNAANAVSQATEQATRMSFQAEVKRFDEEMEQLAMRGMWNVYLEKAENHPDAANRPQILRQAQNRAAMDGYHNVLQSDDVPAMLAAADVVVEDNALTQTQQTTMKQMLESRASQIENATVAKRTQEMDALRTSVVLAANDPDHPDFDQWPAIWARYSDTVYGLGLESTYLSPSFQDGLFKQYQTAQMEKQRRIRSQSNMTTNMHTPLAIDMTDSKHKEDADSLYDQVLFEESQAGNAPAAYGFGVRLATSLNYLPATMRAQMETVSNPAATWEEAQAGSIIYQALKQEKPSLVKDLSRESIAVMELMSQSGRTGISAEDSFQQWRQRISTVDAQLRDRRGREADSTNENGDNHEWFKTAVAGRDSDFSETWLESLVPFYQGGTAPSDDITMAFENSYKNYYTLTGDREASLESAYTDVMRRVGLTEVNGRRQIFNDSPEQLLGFESSAIRRDIDWFIDENMDIGDMEAKDYGIVENVNTHLHTGVPTYSMVWWDDNGMPNVLTDEKGVAWLYTPDPKRIAKREKAEEINNAKFEREIKRMREDEGVQGRSATMRSSLRDFYGVGGATAPGRTIKQKQDAQEASRIRFADKRAEEIGRDRQLIQELGLADQI